MLRYTGHPLADVGTATIVAFSKKGRPEDVTTNDLDRVAEYLAKEYLSGVLTPYLSCVFTMNAAYTQPSWKPPRREQEARKLLSAFREPEDPDAARFRCAFCANPTHILADRRHVPMITGENVLNFFPGGLGGLPLCGLCLLAVQVFPLGARRCYGRALAVHSPDDPALTQAFAARFLADNRQLLLLAQTSNEKYADAKAPKTLIIHVLLEIESQRRDSADTGPAPSATVYHLTNTGIGQPDIDLFHLPSQVVGFLRAVSRASTASAWRGIEQAAWERPEAKKTSRAKARKTGSGSAGEKPTDESGPGRSRNFLYEDLFDLPANTARFVRTYFLRRSYRYARERDPRSDYSLSRDRDLVSWELTRLFLKEVIGMEKNRIDAIRELGNRIATHVAAENDRRFFQGLYRTRRYVDLRNLLIKASNARLKKGQPPLLGFDEFLVVFEEGDETARVDWTLARDLVLIRVIEELHRQEWFGKQPEVLEGLDTDDDTGASATP